MTDEDRDFIFRVILVLIGGIVICFGHPYTGALLILVGLGFIG